MRILTTNYVSERATVITASNINSNFPASNLKNQLRSKRVRTATGTTTLTVVFDFVTTEAINSVVLLWATEDGITLTDSAVLTIEANATNVWGAPSVSQVLTIDDDYSVASHHFTTDKSYRYWRLTIVDATNPLDYIELGTCWIGKALSIDNAQNGFKWVDVDRSVQTENDFGHRYVDEYPTTSVLEFSFQFLDYDQIQVLVQAYRTNGVRKPVIVVMDELDTVFDKDHFLIYGNFSKQFGLNHVHYNLLNTEGLKIEELS